MPTRRHKVWLVVVTTSQIDLKSAWLVDLKFHHLRDFCPSAGSNPGQHKAKIWRPAPPRPRKAFLRIIRSCFLVAVDVGGSTVWVTGWVDDASVVSYLESGPKVFLGGKSSWRKRCKDVNLVSLKGKDSFLSFLGWVQAVMKLKLSASNWLPCVLWWVHSKLVEFQNQRCDFCESSFSAKIFEDPHDLPWSLDVLILVPPLEVRHFKIMSMVSCSQEVSCDCTPFMRTRNDRTMIIMIDIIICSDAGYH